MAQLQKTIVQVRQELERSFPLLLKQCGITASGDTGKATLGFEELRSRLLPVIQADEKQLGSKEARSKFIQEAAFTTLNRLVGLKVMEARGLVDRTVITRSVATGGKSEAHYLFLSQNPQAQKEAGQGIHTVLQQAFADLAQELPQLYGPSRYGFLPRASEALAVIELLNGVEEEEWRKDDVVGWVYQYYQEVEKKRIYGEISAGKRVDSSYKLVSVTQFYTEEYIVKYLLDNTLGRYWLEMHPQSPLGDSLEYFDTTVPRKEREGKSVEEIRLLDPSCGSGHFLLYAMDLFHQMYLESGYTENIPQKIVENNLYGLDIDERAIQLTALSLYLKAKRFSTSAKLERSNLYALTMDHFEESELLLSMGLSDVNNPLVRTLFDTLTSLRKLNMVGSLFRTKPSRKKKKGEKTASLVETPPDTSMDHLVEQMVDTIEGKLPGHVDAVSSLLNGEVVQQFNAIRLLMKSFDVVVTNPPYRDSGSLSDELKSFLKDYYPNSKSDLYSAFIEKGLELTGENGFLGMVTMQSFLFISSHEKLRKLLLEKATVSSLVHLGPRAFQSISGEIVNTVMFAMEKGKQNVPSSFHDVKDLDHDEKVQMVWETLRGRVPKRSHSLLQSEFHKIPGSPFVYWVSDKIRGLFGKLKPLEKYANVVQGLATADNDRFLRFWWEVKAEDISVEYKRDRKKWVPYAKGGPYNKWYGNLWWVVNWENDGREIKNYVVERYPYINGKYEWVVKNESYYFKEGLTYSFVSSFGFSCRYSPKNSIFDVGGSSMFPISNKPEDFLGIISSKLESFFMRVLNPTVNYQVGDLKNLPMVDPGNFPTKKLSLKMDSSFSASPFPHTFELGSDKLTLSTLAQDCIALKKSLYTFHVMERDFQRDPLDWALQQAAEQAQPPSVKLALEQFFLHKAQLEAQLLINEALNDELVFKLYGLLPEERTLTDLLNHPELWGSIADDGIAAVYEVLDSEGVPVGAYPPRELTEEENQKLRKLYLEHRHHRGSSNSEAILGMDFGIVEEIAGALQLSPASVVEYIARIDALPPQAAKDVLSEHIQALVLDILRQDNDGIVSLSSDTGEASLSARIVQKWRALGIGDSYHELEELLGKPIEQFLERDFFKAHSKRFMNRPIVWHLVSDGGTFHFFVLHHAWSYDRILLLRNKYIGEVKRTLDNTLATETNEKNRQTLLQKLGELDRFATTLDQLLDGHYLPEVDSGVAKNIAPLQQKGLLKFNPLSSKMVAKMLHVEWK